MARTITQKVVFKNTPVSTLYGTYINARQHSASVGVAAKIQNKEGAKFSAHDNYVTGKNLQLIKNKLIVQAGGQVTGAGLILTQHSYFFLNKQEMTA
jgi:hypothetical protein